MGAVPALGAAKESGRRKSKAGTIRCSRVGHTRLRTARRPADMPSRAKRDLGRAVPPRSRRCRSTPSDLRRKSATEIDSRPRDLRSRTLHQQTKSTVKKSLLVDNLATRLPLLSDRRECGLRILRQPRVHESLTVGRFSARYGNPGVSKAVYVRPSAYKSS